MDYIISPKRLPRNLGILGMSLPFILVIGDRHLAPSISHYYYTDMGVYFTSVLFAFGLFLFTYEGYKKKKEHKYKGTDNLVTNIAGFFAICTALIPTGFNDADLQLVFGGPNAHRSEIAGTIHLACAGSFLIIMGYLSIFRFTLSGKTKSIYYARRYKLYQICGWMVWVCIAFLGVEFLLHKSFTPYDVFFGELISLIFFGFAWLVKSQIKQLKYIGLVSEEEIIAYEKKCPMCETEIGQIRKELE